MLGNRFCKSNSGGGIINLKNMEKPDEEKLLEKIPKEEQLTEGVIEDYDSKNLKEQLKRLLPGNIEPEKVIVFCGPKGWMWRLRSEYVRDSEKRKRYQEEEEA